MRVSEDIVAAIGNTPLIKLERASVATGCTILGKAEFMNPGQSVKDRPARQIILEAEKRGEIGPGGLIVEATAGNTGIGLALIGVNRGYQVALFVPENFSEEKVIIMRALGAEVVRTPDEEGMSGAIRRAQELADNTPGAFMAAQFENPANPDYHYQTTAQEIFEQMDGRIDAMTIGSGTAGTFTGVARYLKQRLPEVWMVAVETEGSVLGGGPPGPHKVEGIGASFIPKNFDGSVCDEILMVNDENAFNTVKALAAKEGVLSGSSGGANVFAAFEVAQRLGRGRRVVTIIPDSAERYLSKKIFEGGV